MAGPRQKNPEPYSYERAWNYALWLLGRQMRTHAQVRERLTKKGAAPEDIDAVLAKLIELRYLDDAAFAEAYVASRKSKKGRLAINQELAQKGVGGELRERALAGVSEEEQQGTARALVEKNLWRWAGKKGARSKAFAFLARRGFPGEVVQGALEDSGLTDGNKVNPED